MNERITLIALFNKEGINTINNLVEDVKEQLCKVPFGKNVTNRILCDTLPFHITVATWNVKMKDIVIEKLSKLSFNSFKIFVNNLEIVESTQNSFILRFIIADDKYLKAYQNKIVNILSINTYKPSIFHITITCDTNLKKINKIKDTILKKFKPFYLEINALGLFEIYPANLVYKIK